MKQLKWIDTECFREMEATVNRAIESIRSAKAIAVEVRRATGKCYKSLTPEYSGQIDSDISQLQNAIACLRKVGVADVHTDTLQDPE